MLNEVLTCAMEFFSFRFAFLTYIMEWPTIEVLSSKEHTECKLIGCSWLPRFMSLITLSALFVPYLIVVARGSLYPFLPLVSQVVGSPPQSGIFSLINSLSTLSAFIVLNLFFMGIRIQQKRLQDERMCQTASLLNRISLISGHIFIIGQVLVGSYPFDFYRKTELWFGDTVIPHIIGAVFTISGAFSYCVIITYIMAVLHPEQKRILKFRIFLMSVIALGLLLIMCFLPASSYMSQGITTSCVIRAEDISYNLPYLICSVSEWLLLLSFITFFMTLQNEGKDFCFTLGISLREDNKSNEREQVQQERKKQKIRQYTGAGNKETAVKELS